MRTLISSALLSLALLLSSVRFSASYLAQAALGQLGILRAARPLPAVLTDPGTPERTRQVLALVPEIKRYGEASGLRVTGSYERYAALGRTAAAWVVQGSSPLAFERKLWRFPIVGSVPYLGFFDEAAARRYAGELAAGGLDVDVRTAGAFSTLGWFRDPILSTMLPPGAAAAGALANVVLHESVHATVYVKDQTPFDETLASFVADRLTPRWLAARFGPHAPETVAWAESCERSTARGVLLHRTFVALDAVYRSGASDAAKRAHKARILAEASAAANLARPLNNAVLLGFETYGSDTSALDRLLAACGDSWPRFMDAVRAIAPGDFAAPHQAELGGVVDGALRRARTVGDRG